MKIIIDINMVEVLKQSLKSGVFIKENVLDLIHCRDMPLIYIKYLKDRKIIRTRVNDDVDSFSRVSDLSYPPSEYAKLNRLSTNGESMFYGSVFSQSSRENNCFPRIVNIFEISESFLYMNDDRHLMATVSNWAAKRDLNLLAFPLGSYHRNFAESEDIRRQYNKIKNNYSKESRDIAKYIGYLLSQKRKSCLYEITSTVAHYLLYDNPNTKLLDGILYPSVQTDGEGVNLCLKPEVANTSIEFLGARKQELIKKGKTITVRDIADAKADMYGNLHWGPVSRIVYQDTPHTGLKLTIIPTTLPSTFSRELRW